MTSFEYIMVLVSIIIALAIAHLLTAVAATVHRLRGHGEPIELDAVYGMWIAYVLIWLISFWWWEFKFQEVVIDWYFGLYLFVIVYAIVLVMLAAILVPHRMQGVTRTYDYFVNGRKWFFGTLLLAQVVDIADTFLKGYDWGVRPAVLISYSVVFTVAITGIITERRWLQLGAAAVALAAQLIYLLVKADICHYDRPRLCKSHVSSPHEQRAVTCLRARGVWYGSSLHFWNKLVRDPTDSVR